MPHSIVVKITPRSDFDSPPNIGECLRGLIFDLIRRHNPAFAEHVHNRPGDMRGFSISGLASGPAGDPYFRIGTYDDELGAFLLHALHEETQGEHEYHIGRQAVQLSLLADPSQNGYTSSHYKTYDFLYASATDDNKVILEFLSPTAFSFGKRQVLEPEPHLCFKNYLRAWTVFDPEERYSGRAGKLVQKIKEVVTLEGCVIRQRSIFIRQRADHDQEASQHDQAGGGFVKLRGFIGQASFMINSRDTDFRRTLHALSGLSPYRGTGSNVTLGMGNTRKLD